MKPLSDLNAAEVKFLHVFTRRALINWCAQGLANGDSSFDPTVPGDLPGRLSHGGTNNFAEELVEYARSKNWISKKGHFVLGAAYKSATGMLKVL